MDNLWYRLFFLIMLLFFILAPFAGFAPLMLVILIAGVCYFLYSIARILVFGKSEKKDYSSP